MSRLYLLKIVMSMLLFTIQAGVSSGVTFSGYMFGDYFWMASHHDADIKDANGFWMRRIYLTFDYSLTPRFSTRVRFEMNSRGDFSTTSSALVPYIKDAYLKWQINRNHQMYLGISPPPTFDYIEGFWGYRFLEKTALDLQRWGPSREFGVSLKGNLVSSGTLQYHVMLGNGNGNKSETNIGKKWMGALRYFPVKQFVLEAYADWNDKPGHTDWKTYQIFAGYQGNRFRMGSSFSRQVRQTTEGTDAILDLLSVFAVWEFHSQWSVVARVDRQFDPNPEAAKQQYLPFHPTSSSTFFLAGVDFRPHSAIHLMPNIEIIKYDRNEQGEIPTSDVVPRITFFCVFK